MAALRQRDQPRCGNATNRALIVWLEARWEQIAALLEQGERFVEVR